MIDKSFWVGKKVLVTGHTGFKGSWMCLVLLNFGAEVHGVSLEPNTKPNLFEELNLKDLLKSHHICNICNFSAFKDIFCKINPDIVFHLAAQPLVRQSYKHPIETWTTNVIGSLNILESVKQLSSKCSVVMITTDKVYKNKEWDYGYRENDELGGHDPYSASKAACEIMINSWKKSFCNADPSKLIRVATARAGNVVGGGDWSKDRIIPDIVNSLMAKDTVEVRNPVATRPWQHVLEPIFGYMLLAQLMHDSTLEKVEEYCQAFNFGPYLSSNKTVKDLVELSIQIWGQGRWEDKSSSDNPHEAHRLHLQVDKAWHLLGWKPLLDFNTTIKMTIEWYRHFVNGSGSAFELCSKNIQAFSQYLINGN